MPPKNDTKKMIAKVSLPNSMKVNVPNSLKVTHSMKFNTPNSMKVNTPNSMKVTKMKTPTGKKDTELKQLCDYTYPLTIDISPRTRLSYRTLEGLNSCKRRLNFDDVDSDD